MSAVHLSGDPMVSNDPPTLVAFFRAMNLGQARSHSPTSAVLLEVFTAAGARWATNFQTNGTVIFAAADVAGVTGRVRTLLLSATGYTDAVIIRPAVWVIELGRRLDRSLPGAEVALFDAPTLPEPEFPWVDAAGKLTILTLDRLHAVTSWTATGAGSSSNPTLTRMLGVPVTCRGVPTMIRLAARLTR